MLAPFCIVAHFVNEFFEMIFGGARLVTTPCVTINLSFWQDTRLALVLLLGLIFTGSHLVIFSLVPLSPRWVGSQLVSWFLSR